MKSVFLDVFEDSRLQICKPHSAFNPEIFFKGAMHKMPPLDVVVVQCSSTSQSSELCKDFVKQVYDSSARGRPSCFPLYCFFLFVGLLKLLRLLRVDYLRLKRDSHVITEICAQPSK